MSNSSESRVLVIIPAYNEQESLSHVITNVHAALPEADVLVINDGSHDATRKVGEQAGARVVTLPYNLGIGAAVQTGFIFAAENGYDIAVQVDGDGQHDPHEVGALLALVRSGTADIVIGSRYIEDRGYLTPAIRRLGIYILAKYISALVKQRFTDTTSGFRVTNRRGIELCAELYPADYPEPESLVLFRKVGLRVLEVPVTMNPRYGGQSSITPFWSTYYMVKVMLAIAVWQLRRRPTL